MHTNQFNDGLAQFELKDRVFCCCKGWSTSTSTAIVVAIVTSLNRCVFIHYQSGKRLYTTGIGLNVLTWPRLGLPVVASLLSIIISIRNEALATKINLICSSFRCRHRESQSQRIREHTYSGGCCRFWPCTILANDQL